MNLDERPPVISANMMPKVGQYCMRLKRNSDRIFSCRLRDRCKKPISLIPIASRGTWMERMFKLSGPLLSYNPAIKSPWTTIPYDASNENSP